MTMQVKQRLQVWGRLKGDDKGAGICAKDEKGDSEHSGMGARLSVILGR